jgi:hypothetical protein
MNDPRLVIMHDSVYRRKSLYPYQLLGCSTTFWLSVATITNRQTNGISCKKTRFQQNSQPSLQQEWMPVTADEYMEANKGELYTHERTSEYNADE